MTIYLLLKLSKEASSNSGSKSGNSGLGNGGKLKPVLSEKSCDSYDGDGDSLVEGYDESSEAGA